MQKRNYRFAEIIKNRLLRKYKIASLEDSLAMTSAGGARSARGEIRCDNENCKFKFDAFAEITKARNNRQIQIFGYALICKM